MELHGDEAAHYVDHILILIVDNLDTVSDTFLQVRAKCVSIFEIYFKVTEILSSSAIGI